MRSSSIAARLRRLRAMLPALALAPLAAGLISADTAHAATNLPPSITVPGAQTTNEDTSRSLAAANAISVSDPDAGANAIEVALSVTNGTLTLSGTTGLVFGVGDGAGDGAMTFTGTVTDINAALEGTTYTPATNYNGADALVIGADDLGNTGTGGAMTAVDSVAITVSAVNDNPVNTVPGDQVTVEETPLTLSAGNANAISVADVDAGAANVQVTLDTRVDGVSKGTTSVSQTAGLSFTSGDGTSDPVMSMIGTIAAINAALDGMTFTPVKDLLSGARLRVTTSDLGNTGSGGTRQDADEFNISATNTDDPPSTLVPAGVGTYAGQPRQLSLADLNQISVNDVDDPESNNTIEIGLAVSDGTLTFDTLAGVTVLSGADGTGAITLRALRSSITGAFDTGVTYTPPAGFTGQATIAINTSEPGTGPLSESDTLAIEVDPPGGDMVYWTAAKETAPFTPGGLGRAALDGSGGVNLITGPELMDTPSGIAIDAVEGRIYWANTGASTPALQGIWSANLDGTDKQLFLTAAGATAAGTKLNSAFGMVVDQETRRLYWANSDNATAANRGISYVSLDDPTSGGRVSTGAATVTSPRAIALDRDNDRVYWTNWSGAGQSIAFAPLPGASGTSGNFTVSGVSQPSGVAVDLDTNRLFWANGTGTAGDETQRLKVAALPTPFSATITSAALDISPNAGGGLRASALDPAANRIYWANSSFDRISYANLDGTGGGADLPTASAYTNSPDAVTILRRPAAAGGPSISGTAQVGATLTCSDAEWAADLPNGALYRAPASTALAGWTRDGDAIAGATSATHTPAAAGEYRCARSATNFAGTTTVTSDAVTVAAAPSPPAPPPPPPPPAAQTPTLRISAARAAVSTAGVVDVAVLCSDADAAACAGTAELTTAARLVAKTGSRSTTISAGTKIGTGSIATAAGATTARMTLNATGRRLASSRTSIPATLTAKPGALAPVTAAITLTPAQAPAISPRSSRARLRGGRISVRLHCAAATGKRCRGTLTLTAAIGGSRKTIASGKLALRGGRTSTVSLALTPAARVRLRRGALSARQEASSTVEVGRATLRARTLRVTR
jgi:hypothetical protein